MRKTIGTFAKRCLGATWTARVQSFLDAPRRNFATERQLRYLSLAVVRGAYSSLLPEDCYRSPLNRHELRVFSQNGEDGILLYLFSRIGTKDRRFIEFGVNDGTECNTANLAINFGWRGLIMDGSTENVARAQRHYAEQLLERAPEVVAAQAFVTAENADALFQSHGFQGELDLLSIDVDGNDYWIWKGISSVSPRVVVVEYNAVFGPHASITIPYDPGFRWETSEYDLLAAGASLSALARLGKEKGYILAGCNSSGVNAFFVREDAGSGVIEELAPEQAYFPLRDRVHGLVLPVDQSRLAGRDLVRV